MKLLLRVEYEYEVDPANYDDDGVPGPAELCKIEHGIISEDPRGIQDRMEEPSARRVALVVSPC